MTRMPIRSAGTAALILIAAACTSPAPAPGPTLAMPSPIVPAAGSPAAGQPLAPDPSAEYTVGDSIRFTDGETDQADLAVLDAVMLPLGPSTTTPRYAFLVEITGLDDIGFLYNILDFTLFDDESFEYLPLFDGGQEPALNSGELTPGQKVRGWLTFDGPVSSSFVELQYAPELAIEQERVRVLVP
jgi:hypothetical protein